MLCTYNGRAVQILLRADSRRRRAWQWAPSTAWLCATNAFVLVTIALCNLKAGKPGLRTYEPAIHAYDLLVVLAAAFLLVAIYLLGRAHQGEWTDSIRRSLPKWQIRRLSARPMHVWPDLALRHGIQRDWQHTKVKRV